MNKPIDLGFLLVMAITLGLFIAALFIKGLSHNLFLEAGVFLVSVKIIIMAYRHSVSFGHLDRKLDAILARLSKAGRENGKIEYQSRNQPDPI
jgi:hypothetical protein